jgi:hypothetical protein
LVFAGVLGFATLVLWVLLQAIDLAPEDLHASDYEPGLWICVASLVVLAGGVLLMGGRPREHSPAADNPGPAHESAGSAEPTVAEETRRPSGV